MSRFRKSLEQAKEYINSVLQNPAMKRNVLLFTVIALLGILNELAK